MSVLESIKGTFHSVQQDIVEGIKALTSLDTQSRHENLRRLRTDGVSLDAGADLLNKYQKTWKELQDFTTLSAKKAEEVDSDVGHLYVQWERQADMMSRFEEEVAELPGVMELIKKITNDLAYIQEDCTAVEGALERLENVCEEIEHQRNQAAHLAQLAQYKQKKAEEVQKVKVQMAKSHAQAMAQCDRQRQANLKDRQEAFGEAFSHDIEYYKSHGHADTQLKVKDIPIPKVSSLSDITLDDDQMVINNFLASTEVTPSTEKPADGLGEMSEGAFIEDDYTTDYNIQSDEDILADDLDQMKLEPDNANVEEGGETSAQATDGCEGNAVVRETSQGETTADATAVDQNTPATDKSEETCQGETTAVESGQDAVS